MSRLLISFLFLDLFFLSLNARQGKYHSVKKRSIHYHDGEPKKRKENKDRFTINYPVTRRKWMNTWARRREKRSIDRSVPSRWVFFLVTGITARSRDKTMKGTSGESKGVTVTQCGSYLEIVTVTWWRELAVERRKERQCQPALISGSKRFPLPYSFWEPLANELLS